MKTLTPEERERLAEHLAEHDAVFAPLMKWVEPLLKTLRLADEMRNAIFERHGVVGEVMTCEHCEALILPGDSYAHYEDGPTHCEACAPTYQDSLDQQREIAADENAHPDERAEANEVVARLEQLSAEELSRKILLVND